MNVLVTIGAIVLIAVVTLSILGALLARLYRKVQQGQALIISKTRGVEVTFTGATVLPVIHKAEVMDIGVKVIEVTKNGNDGLICKDNIRADIGVSFYVRVNPTADDVRKVAQLVGCSNASSQEKLEQLFSAKFSESLKTAGKQMEFVELYDLRDQFRANVIGVIGNDLNGYVLDDVAIQYLEQTPMDQLNPQNVLDAEGIKKITEITSREMIAANTHRREAEKQTKSKDVETQQAIYEMERQEKAAEFRALREMATTKAREESMTAQVEADERLKAEVARLRTDEQIGIQKENLQREVEVAGKNRERAIAIETEKIEKARQLEVVARNVETTSASKDLETEKAHIAELQKARIAVEKTVAEQEESIATLRMVEQANREKESTVIAAGAQAEAVLITTIKEAEARERASTHIAKERLTLAEADKSAADLDATARIRRAEGSKAESAAFGLAEVEVARAKASVIEQTGLATARAKEADAAAVQAQGEAQAASTRAIGSAEAANIEAKLRGEAAGLTEKAAAMRELEGVGKEYDLAVRHLEADVQVRTAGINAQRDAVISQSTALGQALSSAKIDIVGGTDMFVDRILGSVAAGRAVDGFVNGNDTTAAIAKPYLNGERDLLALAGSSIAGLGSQGITNLTLAHLLSTVATRIGGDEGSLLAEIIETVKAKGLGDLNLNELSK
jgi:uncharacterized membrane protein YqiK